MILFRHHRGGFSESMKTVKEFSTLEELFTYLSFDSKGAFSQKDIY